MGMTIDEIIKQLSRIKAFHVEPPIAISEAIDALKKYQMFQRAYEQRLKADMVAMLTEIQLEIEENTIRWYVGRVDGKSDDVVLMETINDIIQQKITNLQVNNSKVKEQTDD